MKIPALIFSLAAALVCGAAAPAPVVQVTGMVAHAGPVALASLPQVTVAAKFNTMHGPQAHRWSGPLVANVVAAAGVQDEPGKRTHMRHVVMAVGSDGYGAAIALGEFDAMAEGKQIIVAVREDDKPMAAPRLVVPGDSSFTRGVHDLVTLEVR
jgi:hypothetical protein